MESAPGAALPWDLKSIYQLMILAAAAGLVLVGLGPFGTYLNMRWAERFIFWESVLLCAATVHIPALWLAERFGRAWGLPAPLWIAIAGLIAAVPTTLLVTGIIATLYGLPSPPGYADMYSYVVCISVPMQALSYAILRWRGQSQGIVAANDTVALPVEPQIAAPAPLPLAEPSEPVVAPSPRVPLLARLPALSGSELLCLEMQDHYVRLHTTAGAALLLMRMSDAEAELGDLPGRRVHRSWWVAKSAVVDVRRRGQSIMLELSNGLLVPVSRARLPELREERWLAPA